MPLFLILTGRKHTDKRTQTPREHILYLIYLHRFEKNTTLGANSPSKRLPHLCYREHHEIAKFMFGNNTGDIAALLVPSYD